MLDLQPIKDRVTAASNGPWKWQRDTSGWWTICDSVGGEVASANLVSEKGPATANGQLLAHAPADLAALVAEVERLRTDADVRERYISALEPIVRRLREAIGSHKRRCVIDPQPWDRDLWAVLDA